MKNIFKDITRNVQNYQAKKKTEEERYVNEDLPAEIERLKQEVAQQDKRDKLEAEKQRLLDLKNKKKGKSGNNILGFNYDFYKTGKGMFGK